MIVSSPWNDELLAPLYYFGAECGYCAYFCCPVAYVIFRCLMLNFLNIIFICQLVIVRSRCFCFRFYDMCINFLNSAMLSVTSVVLKET